MSDILDEVTVEQSDPSVYESTTGLKLRLKKVPRLTILEAIKKLKRPEVPKWYNPDKDREEENPADPEYIAALQKAKFDQGMLAISIYLVLGTEVLEIPDGMQPHTETEWSEDLESFGIDIPARGKSRYAAWLKYYILDDDEFNRLTNQLMKYSGGVTEEDVKKAMESFRGDEGQPADNIITLAP